jgi:hypothetical protein
MVGPSRAPAFVPVANEGYALFVASFQQFKNPNPDAWQALCTKQANPRNPISPTSAPNNYFSRPFATSSLPDMTCPFSDGVPQPYQAVGCGCLSDSDCYSGHCGQGSCLWECQTDLDCGPGLHCYADKGLCSSPNGCSDLHHWEACSGPDECGSNYAAECGDYEQPCCSSLTAGGGCNGSLVCVGATVGPFGASGGTCGCPNGGCLPPTPTLTPSPPPAQ